MSARIVEPTYTQSEIDAHRHEMREALDGGLISQAEYDGQMMLMDEIDGDDRD